MERMPTEVLRYLEHLSSGGCYLGCDAEIGSTWLMQIMHGLRSNGDMNFEDITLMCPDIEFAHDVEGAELESEQRFHPRMYKTHFLYEACPKGEEKYIVLRRNLKDAAVSMYSFLKGWLFDSSEISLETFIEWIFLKNTVNTDERSTRLSVLDHLGSWYPHRNDANVLLLHYEDMKEDLTKCIRLVSDFLNIGVGNEELLNLVEHQAGFDFMKTHGSQFNAHAVKESRNAALGLNKHAGVVGKCSDATLKFREGKMDVHKKYLSPEILAGFDAKWQSVLKPITGYDSYEDMRDGINKELGRSFLT